MLNSPVFWIAVVSWAVFAWLAVHHWRDSAAVIQFIDTANPDAWSKFQPAITGIGRGKWVINRLMIGWVSCNQISSDPEFRKIVFNGRVSMCGMILFCAIAFVAMAPLPNHLAPPPGWPN